MSGPATVLGPLGHFDDLYEHHFTRLVSALGILGATAPLAEVEAATALARAVLRWGSTRDPVAYVYRIAIRRRRRATRRARMWPRAASAPETPGLGPAAVFAQLTPRQRECAVLAWHVGCSPSEVATVLRVRPATALADIDRARRALGSVVDRRQARLN